MVEQHPVRTAAGHQPAQQPDPGHPDLDDRPVGRRGEPFVQPDQGPLPPGAVGDLRRQLAGLVGAQLRFQVVEEPLPPHTTSLAIGIDTRLKER